MEAIHEYQIELTWTQQRKGVLRSAALPLEIEVATPPDFPKGMEGFWSPEHLFIGAVASCYMTTLLAVAENSGLAFTWFDINAVGTVIKEDGKYRVSDIILKPALSVLSSPDIRKAVKVAAMTEKNCLISNSISTRVHVAVKVEVAVPKN